jgi:lipopolysaccharide export system protein LptA
VRFRLATYSIFLSIGFGLGLFTIPAHAERADKDKPIALSSDKALFDDVKQIYYLERNVLLIKGSLIIKGEKAEVKIDPEGYQFVTIFAKPGEQASLRQKRDTGFNDFIEGFAELIEYDGKTDIAILQKQARMNQISGTRVTDQLNGDKIHYDGNTEKYNVVSKVSVKSTLSPRRKESTGPSK